MPFAPSGGHRIHYRDLGDSTRCPLVMLRGLLRSGDHWEPELLEWLQRDFRLLLVDNLGVGYSDAPVGLYSTERMGNDVAAVLDVLNISQAHCFGTSLGGMVAQWFAILHPHRLRRLVLGATLAGGKTGPWVPLRTQWTMARCAGYSLGDAFRHTALYTLSEEARAHKPEIVERWTRSSAQRTYRRSGALGQIWAARSHNVEKHLHRIAHPALVLTGDLDRVIPVANSYALAERLPRGRLAVLPGAGHEFPDEQPEETYAHLRAFLAHGSC